MLKTEKFLTTETLAIKLKADKLESDTKLKMYAVATSTDHLFLNYLFKRISYETTIVQR